jgi:hypothetical protein
MSRQHVLPVWFFIGMLLLIYGIIILAVGIIQFSHPAPVVLASNHLNLWGGGLLIALGGFYTLRFRPRRRPNP